MSGMLLTQYQGSFLGPIAKILGILMDAIFNILDVLHIPNIGLSIILFTIIIYLLMMPLTIKQQKFSKLSAKMNPELQAIQAKYKNKKDNDSMMAMNQETQAVYAKYGVSPTGSCLQLLIQMPILFALYRVIYAIPAYVGKVGEAFGVLADKIISGNGVDYIQEMTKAAQFAKNFNLNTRNAIIDVLNVLSSTELADVASKFDLSKLTYEGQLILSNGSQRGLLDTYNNFLGLNIANSPSATIQQALNAEGGIQWMIIIGAAMVPVLSALTQWINVKLMPQPSTDNSENSMASSMKMMNNVMPIMSAVFCYTLPAGMGIYWIAGAVVRTVQQVIINKHIDKMDLDEVIKKNIEKRNKKLEKKGINPNTLNTYANMNTRNVNTPVKPSKPVMSQEEKDAAMKKASEYYSKNAKPGSIAAKANMVKQYNEKNNK